MEGNKNWQPLVDILSFLSNIYSYLVQAFVEKLLLVVGWFGLWTLFTFPKYAVGNEHPVSWEWKGGLFLAFYPS